MKTLILLVTLIALITFNWDKVPTPIKVFLEGVKNVSTGVIMGLDMPAPVKNYVDSAITPKAEKLKDRLTK